MTTLNKQYNYLINENRVEIKKVYRTKTQFEYFLKIFMGNSDYESGLIYNTLFLTKKNALNHAKHVILNAPQPKIVERVIFPEYEN